MKGSVNICKLGTHSRTWSSDDAGSFGLQLESCVRRLLIVTATCEVKRSKVHQLAVNGYDIYCQPASGIDKVPPGGSFDSLRRTRGGWSSLCLSEGCERERK